MNTIKCKRCILMLTCLCLIYTLLLIYHSDIEISDSSIKTREHSEMIRAVNNNGFDEEITLVTAFLDLGDKGHGPRRSNQKYFKWMEANSGLQNPIVAYFNTRQAYDAFNKARDVKLKNKTMSKIITTNDLWSFSYRDETARVLQHSRNLGYAHTNMDEAYTAEYMCTMHAKYEFLQQTIRENPFKTKYFAWIDIAHLHHFNERTDYIYLPDDFDRSKVAYQEAYQFMCGSEYDIFHKDMIWIGGQIFIATAEVMLNWIEIYRQFVEYYLSKGLMDSDEQVLLAMYCHHFRLVDHYIQPYYAPKGFFNSRMYLTHKCRINGDTVLRQNRIYNVTL